MKTIGTWATLIALTVSGATAQAQDEAAGVEAEATATAEAPAAEEPTEKPKETDSRMSDPMASFGLSARIGMTAQTKRKAFLDGEDLGSGDGENGLNFIFGLNLGDGHGFGVDLNFDLRRYKTKGDASLGVPDLKFGDFTFEPIFGARFQLIDPLYMFVGAGPRIGLGWIDAPGSNKAAVAGFRIPVQVNYYFIPMMAAQFELGFGWDVFMQAVDDFTSSGNLLYLDRGWVIDFQFGLRFF